MNSCVYLWRFPSGPCYNWCRFSLLHFFFQKCSWVFGAPHAPTRGSRGVGKRCTSSYDHDMWPVKIVERSGLAVKSYHPETLAAEVIIRKPWRRKKKKKKNKIKKIFFWQNHKAFPAGSRECLIHLITKVYFNEHLTHSCVGMPQGLQALSSSYICNWPLSSAAWIWRYWDTYGYILLGMYSYE